MKRKNRIILSAVVFALFVAVATIFSFKAYDVITAETFEDERMSDHIDEFDANTEDVFSQASTWGDAEIQSVIHKMSHQKVEASEKWGAIQMTSKRIEILSSIIEQQKGMLKHYDVYREIVDLWMDGKFENVDEHHNRVWRLQGGSVGEATGVLSADQERAFIDKVFN